MSRRSQLVRPRRSSVPAGGLSRRCSNDERKRAQDGPTGPCRTPCLQFALAVSGAVRWRRRYYALRRQGPGGAEGERRGAARGAAAGKSEVAQPYLRTCSVCLDDVDWPPLAALFLLASLVKLAVDAAEGGSNCNHRNACCVLSVLSEGQRRVL